MTIVDRFSATVINAAAPSLALVRGEGCVVVDDAGNSYIDVLSGIAVNILGHAHPAVVEAVTTQLATLGHVSNLFANRPATELAERLLVLAGRSGTGGDGRVFYANSGAEANETAFKISRRTGRRQIISTHGGFHGRTMAALAMTGQPEKAGPFQPLPGEVTHIPYGDVAALEAAVTDATAMVILEPIQGETGVVVPPPGYLAAARAITERRGALLALDEVQSGMGRTGHWFAHQAEGLEPDIITLAKGIGGGLPLGACLALGPAAGLLRPGDHQSTFGGNPVCCAAALAVIATIERDGLLDRATQIERRLRSGVEVLGHPLVAGVRGSGVMLGIALTAPVSGALNAALASAGFLANAVRPAVLRIAPSLIISDGQLDALIAALPAALDQASATAGRTP
ncbi:MAG: acetylornithine transaminase [Dactylosporangium sp.]|nr:acetylornithine transaminase [Dactylosporangium sp.]NNJ61777.1 acetylornithine transaminase [Dactylosporangium sp.]